MSLQVDRPQTVAVVLGARPDNGHDWELPRHVYGSLDRAAELYRQGVVRRIVVSGRWTLNFDILGIHQPFTECSRMAAYLERTGIPPADILREDESKDTISNLYYLKRQIFEPLGLRDLLIIAAGPRLARIAFLCSRILGPGYRLSYDSIGRRPDKPSDNEQRRLDLQSAFLAPMRDGDDSWLDGKFYVGSYYNGVRSEVLRNADREPYIAHASSRSDSLA